MYALLADGSGLLADGGGLLAGGRAFLADGGGGGGDSGAFDVVWGLTATVFGSVVLTDFRGAAYRLALWQAERRSRVPNMTVFRGGAGLFALVGLIFLVIGVAQTADGRLGVFRERHMPVPAIVVMSLGVVGAMVKYWRPRGLLNSAWNEGESSPHGALRRTACVVGTLGVVGFGVSLALGLMIVAVVSCAVAGCTLAPLLLSHRQGAAYSTRMPSPSASTMTRDRS